MTNAAAALFGIIAAGLLAAAQPDPCTATAISQRVAAAHAEQSRFDDAAAAAQLKGAAARWPACGAVNIAALAAEGWVEARRLAAIGGAPDALSPIRSLLAGLEASRAGQPATSLVAQSAAYADAVLRAAVAAAQDERDEMQLYLAHARPIADSLALAGEPRPWPLPMDLVEGELWFEVDRYQDAAEALSRVLEPELAERAALTRGLAWQRIGDPASACDALRRATGGALIAAVRQRASEAAAQLACSP